MGTAARFSRLFSRVANFGSTLAEQVPAWWTFGLSCVIVAAFASSGYRCPSQKLKFKWFMHPYIVARARIGGGEFSSKKAGCACERNQEAAALCTSCEGSPKRISTVLHRQLLLFSGIE
uniref:Uncharacterized protein n=1 Tax=Physcomitrium patens TaxID=3218 RepID=A0A2K1ITZ7_PHYPA|nr:hypothetical protein PHYPA_024691 [Physcomitrium patens]